MTTSMPRRRPARARDSLTFELGHLVDVARPSGASSVAGGCSMSPCTPTVLQCTTRRTPARAAASTISPTAIDVDRAIGVASTAPPGGRRPRCDTRRRRRRVAASSARAIPDVAGHQLDAGRSEVAGRLGDPAPARARCGRAPASSRARWPPVNPVAPVTRARTVRRRASPAIRRGCSRPSRIEPPFEASVKRREPIELVDGDRQDELPMHRPDAEAGARSARRRSPDTRTRGTAPSWRRSGREQASQHGLERRRAAARGIVDDHEAVGDAAQLGDAVRAIRGVCIRTRRLTTTSNARSGKVERVGVADQERHGRRLHRRPAAARRPASPPTHRSPVTLAPPRAKAARRGRFRCRRRESSVPAHGR